MTVMYNSGFSLTPPLSYVNMTLLLWFAALVLYSEKYITVRP